MKTTKAKTTSKPAKTNTAGNTVKAKKAASGKYVPSEEEIREKAREIYYERMHVANMELRRLTGVKQKNY